MKNNILSGNGMAVPIPNKIRKVSKTQPLNFAKLISNFYVGLYIIFSINMRSIMYIKTNCFSNSL